MNETEPVVPLLFSEGQSQVQSTQPPPRAEALPLSADRIEQILLRLPSLPSDPSDQTDFNLSPGLLPPPRTGETLQQAFPPPAQITKDINAETGPLEVLRYSPEGEIPIAPFISITFNQPMIAISTLVDISEKTIPAIVEPTLEGTWRWLGTKTLTFNYDSTQIDRLPKATEYKVTIPAGTTSQTGGVLANAVEFSFSTPPVKITSQFPDNNSQPTNPVIFVAFDQRIEASSIIKSFEMIAGGKKVQIQLANDFDIKNNSLVAGFIKNAVEGRWVAFRPTAALPVDTDIRVNFGPDAPSAEGPLLNKEIQSFGFRTYAPLNVIDHGCPWETDNCRPLSPFYIRFNNPLDQSTFGEGMLKITPELPGVNANMMGDTINIQGASKGRTTYSVILSADIQDIYGQKLGKDTKLTFKVGSADKILFGPEQMFITLDPASTDPVYAVYSINYEKLDVQINAVEPKDWPAFQTYLQEFRRTEQKLILPGKQVFNSAVDVKSTPDTLTETVIKLKPYLNGYSGQFIVVVKPHQGLLEKGEYWRAIQTWIQVTRIGLDAFVDHDLMVAWATDLRDGSSISDVTLSTNTDNNIGLTGEDGILDFPIPDNSSYLVGTKGQDKALLPRSTYYWGNDIWTQRAVDDEIRWYVFDDRQMYKPGEEVHLKGWLRQIGSGPGGDVGLLNNTLSLQYQIIEPQGNEIGNGQVSVNPLGGFDLTFTLPEEINLGYAQIAFSAFGNLINLSNTNFTHSFQIQEFRRPEFEVAARNESPGPYFVGESATVAVEASYYAGGALPNADVTWGVTHKPGNYNPPKWPDFTFGSWTPWWFTNNYDNGEMDYPGNFNGTDNETFSGKTDASGNHYLELSFADSSQLTPISITASATVMDVNRQAWTGTTNLLVHPASLYVGLRSARYFVEKGTPLSIDIIVTDLDGAPKEDRLISAQAARLEWKYRTSKWVEEEVDIQHCDISSRLEPVNCKFDTPIGGTYQITATVTDDKGRKNKTQFTRWVSGGKKPPARKVEKEEISLIPDKENYQPGDIARVLVQSPFSPAEGLLTVSRSGILYTERFAIAEDTITLNIPIEELSIPNLNIQVDVVGSAPRLDDKGETISGSPPRTAYASGQLNLKVPPVQRTLVLEAEPTESELEPGKDTVVNVLLRDIQGNPVQNAEVAVIVVDEAILALSNYNLADPVSIFYSDRPSNLDVTYSRTSIILADPLTLAQNALQDTEGLIMDKAMPSAGAALPTMREMPAPAMEMANESGAVQPAPIKVRSDFNPLAAFSPAVYTNSEGKAQVSVKLPDNLTRYRVMAVAVDQSGSKFGISVSNLVARLPLMVRPSAPRFLNFGDQFELPVILQNQTGSPMEVEVAARANNLTLTGPLGYAVTIPARDRVEVRFPSAAQKAGEVTFQVAAVSGDFADAATINLPVYTPATTEGFATYGVVDEGAIVQPISSPTDVFPQFGGLEINTSSTALQALTDAVLYLVSYPFECSEQLASRVLGVSALRDVLTAFKAKDLPSPSEMEAAVQRDITRLQGIQNDDGGFPYWRHGEKSIPFNTIHVAHALQRAKLKGFDVPETMQQSLLTYLRQIENYYPDWYGEQTRQTLSAYALYTRDLMGDKDTAKAAALLDEAGLENLSLDAVGWLWKVLVDAPDQTARLESIRKLVGNRVVETAGAANFTTSFDDQNYLLLGSNRRTDAILLDALMMDNPDSDLIPKVVNGLMAHREKGRWGSTQENVFVLLALDKYFNTYEAQTPDFVANIWLGETFAGSHSYKGRTTERLQTNIPMNYLMNQYQTQTSTDLIISKDGPGRLYYRLGLNYSPTDLTLDSLDMGFVVERRYEAMDDPEDVRQDDAGIWHIKAGTKVKVIINMVADNRRYHVALVDPLPAGLEIINPALVVTGDQGETSGTQVPRYGWWWHWNWFEHQNLRDERAEVFSSLLWDGVYEYSYTARATTPGKFVVPPAKAEEMYSPEVFGRSGSNIVIVE